MFLLLSQGLSLFQQNHEVLRQKSGYYSDIHLGGGGNANLSNNIASGRGRNISGKL